MNFNAVLIVSSSRSPLTFCPFPSALFSLLSLLLKCALMHVLPGRLEESRIPLTVSQISLHVALECAVGPLDSTQFGAVLPTQSECLSICTLAHLEEVRDPPSWIPQWIAVVLERYGHGEGARGCDAAGAAPVDRLCPTTRRSAPAVGQLSRVPPCLALVHLGTDRMGHASHASLA